MAGEKTKKIVHDKYIKAVMAGKANKANTMLLAAEGDSAITLLKEGLTTKQTGGGAARKTKNNVLLKQNNLLKQNIIPSFENCGIISLQGVVPNAAREITEVECEGENIQVRSAKLQNNKRLNALADAIGVKYGMPATDIKYGSIILCTDQDLDGMGKIAP
jgi:DNA gyrase/topoisomerase IV subunit B